MNRSRPIISSARDFRMYMSTKTKVPNHYDTLNIEQTSTQEDIKLAYYDLSKKLHPDVNQSSNAKREFQDVNDAYEVLGNFQKRKLYDRDLAARGQSTRVRPKETYSSKNADPFATYYRTRASNFDPVKNYDNQINFDFELWTKKHYGQTLRRTLKDKSSKILREKMRQQHEREVAQNRGSVTLILITTFMCTLLIGFQSYYAPLDQDSAIIVKRKSER